MGILKRGVHSLLLVLGTDILDGIHSSLEDILGGVGGVHSSLERLNPIGVNSSGIYLGEVHSSVAGLYPYSSNGVHSSLVDLCSDVLGEIF